MKKTIILIMSFLLFILPVFADVELDFGYMKILNAYSESYNYQNKSSLTSDFRSTSGTMDGNTFYFNVNPYFGSGIPMQGGSWYSNLNIGMNTGFYLGTAASFQKRYSELTGLTQGNGDGYAYGFRFGPALRWEFLESMALYLRPSFEINVFDANASSSTKSTTDLSSLFLWSFSLDAGYRFTFVNARAFKLGLTAGYMFSIGIQMPSNYINSYNGSFIDSRFYAGVSMNLGASGYTKGQNLRNVKEIPAAPVENAYLFDAGKLNVKDYVFFENKTGDVLSGFDLYVYDFKKKSWKKVIDVSSLSPDAELKTEYDGAEFYRYYALISKDGHLYNYSFYESRHDLYIEVTK